MKNKVIIIFLSMFAISLLYGCEGTGFGSCKESCEADSDCQADYRCLVTGNQEQVCLPQSCATCFESGSDCYLEENLAEQEQGEEATCTFRYCQ